MSPGALALGYLGAGAALAIVAIALRRPRASDVLLLVTMWPLWAPLLLTRSTTDEPRVEALFAALARARTSPLAATLPDADNARVLAGRLREASARLAELELVLVRPAFDPRAVEQRAAELDARGAHAAAATAQLRVRTLGRLHALRARYRAELDEVHELIAQLVTQAELVRLQPSAAGASSEVVRELVAQIEGLDQLFAYQASLDADSADSLGAAAEYPPPAARSS